MTIQFTRSCHLMTRSEINSASSGSWVTCKALIPFFFSICLVSIAIFLRDLTSNEENGSSSNSNFGSEINALTKHTLCASPPESVSTEFLANPDNPTSSKYYSATSFLNFLEGGLDIPRTIFPATLR